MLPISLISGDKHRECPYDRTHVILAKSFDAHLIKCRENHKGSKMKTCPLDHTHVVPAPEYNYHVSICEKRSLMDRELQKRAGDDGLKGDVFGPPIVADHRAGQEDDEEENWDDAPKRSYPTPALFNDQVPNASQESYGIIPGGGYVLPKATEPTIRKIPKTPGMAASLSNPMAPVPIRPNRNQVFEYSLSNQHSTKTGTNTNNIWSNHLPSGPLASAPTGMAGVRPLGPANAGPRFIGRGISKYATKNNQTQATTTAVSTSSTPTFTFPKWETESSTYQSGYQSPTLSLSSDLGQFADRSHMPDPPASLDKTSVTSKSDSSIDNFNSVPSLSNNSVTSFPSVLSAPSFVDTNNAMFNSQSQQLDLQKILLYQQQLMDRIKQQEIEQQALVQRHEIQLTKLREIQIAEKQKMLKDKEQFEKDFMTHSKNMQLLLNRSTLNPGGAGSSASSVSSNPGDLMAMMGAMNTGISESLPPGISSAGNIPNSAAKDTSMNGELTKEELQKKLREIEILEQRLSLGHMLSSEETTKLNLKDELSQQLSALQL